MIGDNDLEYTTPEVDENGELIPTIPTEDLEENEEIPFPEVAPDFYESDDTSVQENDVLEVDNVEIIDQELAVIQEARESKTDSKTMLVELLTGILEKGEMTEEDSAELDFTREVYTSSVATIKQIVGDVEGKSSVINIEELKATMVGASVDDILDILTDQGRKPWLYKDSENNVLVDMTAIPELSIAVNKLNLIAQTNESTGQITLNPDFIKMVVEGTGVSEVVIKFAYKYYLSTSKTELVGGIWVDNLPSTQEQKDKFLWYKTITTYKNGKTTESDPICLSAQDGADGVPGKDGITYYTWIRYADDENGSGITNDPTDKKYIGFAYNKTTSEESNNPTDYTWSLIQGEKGDQGVPGGKGEDGQTLYTWIKYSDNPDGTGMYDLPKASTKYIGIATNKPTQSESRNPNDYTWSQFKGDKGDKGPQGVPGNDGTTYYTWIRYADTVSGSGISNDPTGKKYIGFAYNKPTPNESNNPTDYTWSLIKGDKGDQGVPGGKGEDGQTLYTWIKYSDNSNGSGMYDLPRDTTKYIGIAPNKPTQSESNNPNDYIWSKFKGDTGASVEEFVMEYAKNTSTTTPPTTGWSTKMPSYQEGYYLWYRTKATWDDGTVEYSTPICDESWKGISTVKAEFTQTMNGFKQEVSSTYSTKTELTRVEQTANKINWIVQGGTSQSNMTLTQELFSIIANNITLRGEHIEITGDTVISGLVTANNSFVIQTDGSVEASDLTIENTVTANSLVGNELTVPWYDTCLTQSISVYINPNHNYPSQYSEGLDISYLQDAVTFKSFEDLFSVCPRNLNGHKLTIKMTSNLTETIEIKGINNGQIDIHMRGWTLNGWISVEGHAGLLFRIYGNTNSSTGGSTRGIIKPNIGCLFSDFRYAILAKCTKILIYDIDLYKGNATDYPNNCIGLVDFCTGYIKGVAAVNTPNSLLRCHSASHIYVQGSSGTTQSTVFQAVSGSIIHLNNTKQAGRPGGTAQTYTANNGQIFADGATFDKVSQSGSNTDTSTGGTVQKTTTIKSTSGKSYRTSGNYSGTWSSDAVVRQGRWTASLGSNTGCWFFGSSLINILSNTEYRIKGIKLKVTRQSGGTSSAVTHYLRAHTNKTKPSGSPSLLSTGILNKSFSLATGKSITITLSTSEISSLINNKATGFALYTSSTSQSGYSCCSPSLSVTITYTTQG